MYRSLLVPLDGSSLSEHAVPFASAIARRSGAQLRLAHVHVPYTADPIFVDVADSVPGPTADITVLEQSRLRSRLPSGVGGISDLAYVGIDKLHPKGLGAAPRRKPRGKERPPDDITYNRAFSRRRIVVGGLEMYEARCRACFEGAEAQ